MALACARWPVAERPNVFHISTATVSCLHLLSALVDVAVFCFFFASAVDTNRTDPQVMTTNIIHSDYIDSFFLCFSNRMRKVSSVILSVFGFHSAGLIIIHFSST